MRKAKLFAKAQAAAPILVGQKNQQLLQLPSAKAGYATGLFLNNAASLCRTASLYNCKALSSNQVGQPLSYFLAQVGKEGGLASLPGFAGTKYRLLMNP